MSCPEHRGVVTFLHRRIKKEQKRQRRIMFNKGDKVKTHDYQGTNTYGVVTAQRDKDLLVEADDGRIYLFLKTRTRKVTDHEFFMGRQNDKTRRPG